MPPASFDSMLKQQVSAPDGFRAALQAADRAQPAQHPGVRPGRIYNSQALPPLRATLRELLEAAAAARATKS